MSNAALVTCPSCQATLRVPESAETIRCPNCQAVLAIQGAAAPQVPPPPAAPPLPFGKPQPAKAAPKAKMTPPTATPILPKSQSAPKAAPNDELSPEEQEAIQKAKEAREKKKKLREEVDKIEAAQEEKEEEFDYLTDVCAWGQRSLAVMSWGIRLYAISIFLIFVTVILAIVLPEMCAISGPISLGFGGISTLLLTVGFAMAIPGPDHARHIAIMGLIASLLFIGVLVAAAIKAWVIVMAMGENGMEFSSYSGLTVAYLILGMSTNLLTLTDTPARLLMSYPTSVIPIIAGAIELTRFVLVCQLVQLYAEEGKEPETGYLATKAVGRVFWTMLLCAMFRLAVSVGFDNFPKDDALFILGQGMHGILSVVLIMGLVVPFLLFSQIIDHTWELVDPRRYVLKQDRLDLD